MAIGFIGCGNMATAIISGIITNEAVTAQEIYVYDVYKPAMEKLANAYGVKPLDGEKEIVVNCDTVVLAVKPNVLASVLGKINNVLTESDTLLISIAAGKTLEFIRNTLSHDNRIIRVMPNINAVVGEAISAYTANSAATEADRQLCERIFGAVGQIIYLDEKQFPIFGVLGGSAPAFAYLFIDALARGGVKNGMKKDAALMIAAQTVLGSAKMILDSSSNDHPWELIDRVCSPGGTTIEGIASLEADGFETAVMNAVDKTLEKDSKL